jgi:hypothetical protein
MPGSMGIVAAAMLLVVYAVAIGVNLLRGRRDIDCGCAGPASRRPIAWSLVARNVVLAAIGLAGLMPLHARPLHWVDGVTLLATTIAASALYVAADGLLALRAAA